MPVGNPNTDFLFEWFDFYHELLEIVSIYGACDRLIDLIIAGCFKYQSKLQAMVIETIQFQATFKDEVIKRGLNTENQIPIVEFDRLI